MGSPFGHAPGDVSDALTPEETDALVAAADREGLAMADDLRDGNIPAEHRLDRLEKVVADDPAAAAAAKKLRDHALEAQGKDGEQTKYENYHAVVPDAHAFVGMGSPSYEGKGATDPVVQKTTKDLDADYPGLLRIVRPGESLDPNDLATVGDSEGRQSVSVWTDAAEKQREVAIKSGANIAKPDAKVSDLLLSDHFFNDKEMLDWGARQSKTEPYGKDGKGRLVTQAGDMSSLENIRKTVIEHEFGHILENALRQRNPKAWKDIKDYLIHDGKPSAAFQDDQLPSIYAARSPAEYVAESFVNWRQKGNKANRSSRFIGTKLDSLKVKTERQAKTYKKPRGMGSPPPSFDDYLNWNKGKRSAEDVERSMLEKPPEPVRNIPDFTHVTLTDVKGAGGSNGARIAKDKDGNEWLLKTYRGDHDRVATELLANAIYRELGVPVSNAGLGNSKHPEYGDTMALAYPLVKGDIKRWHEPNAELGEGFVADALLANWDVVGLTQDNVLWNNGSPIRLDQGGTLEYRAQGQKKEFGPVPSELWTMRSGMGQANGTMDITEAGMRASAADAAIRLSPERIDELVDQAPFDDEAMRERIRQSLKDRVAWLDAFSRGEVDLPRPLAKKEASDYFAERDSELETMPSEDRAVNDYLGPLGSEIDEHLQSGRPKEEASEEVRQAITEMDMLLGIPETKLDEEVDVYVPIPINIRPEDWDGKWVTEKSYLPLQIEPSFHSMKVTLPVGMNAIMPDALEGTSNRPGMVLVGRNTKLRVKAVRLDDGTIGLAAAAQPASAPKWKPEGMGSPEEITVWKDGEEKVIATVDAAGTVTVLDKAAYEAL